MEFAHAERLWLLLPWTAVILLLGRDQHRALGWLRERVHPKRLGTLTRYASTNFLWHFAWLWLAGAPPAMQARPSREGSVVSRAWLG